jgi:protocatechuate 3,4-dioxygenase beta subunit
LHPSVKVILRKAQNAGKAMPLLTFLIQHHKSQPGIWKKSLAFTRGIFLLILSLAACKSQTPVGRLPTSTAPEQVTSSPDLEAFPLGPTQTPTNIGIMSTSSPTQSIDNQPASAAPVCSSPAPLTPTLTEGPYFKAGSPERSSLFEPDMPGTRLNLTGYVLTTECQPVPHALLDFWQADANGNYDNTGYTLRGHQFTDEKGFYQLTTVVPGLYPGRTEHIHLKVQAPGGPVITSQLFFPDVSNNDSDSIFDPALVINIVQEGDTLVEAAYNFIITP